MFTRIKNKWHQFRSTALSARDHWILGILGDGINKISDERAMQISTVYSCIRVLSETIASLPIKFYRRMPDGGRQELPDYFLAKLFRRPNRFQKKFNFWETAIALLNLRGNFYGGINFNNAGLPAEIIPLNPSRMTVEMKNGRLRYFYITGSDPNQLVDLDAGKFIEYDAAQIWHIRGMSLDGIMGISPIDYAKRSLSLSLNAEDHGIYFYKNGAKTSGIVKVPGKLKENAKDRLVNSIREQTTGSNKFRLLVFEEGMDWQEMGLSNEDSQYLETRGFQVEEIARIFRVPLVLIQHSDKASTYASAEQFFLSFVVHSIRPWLERTEDSLDDLIPDEDIEAGIYGEFNVSGLLRGDIRSRYQSYATGRQWGWLSANDVRQLENMNPIGQDGDIYLQPSNMAPAGDPAGEMNQDLKNKELIDGITKP